MAHYLKRKSSFIVVVLRSLAHKACVSCGKPLHSLEEANDHWKSELEKAEMPLFEGIKEGPVKKGGLKKGPTYPKPNIKPVGQNSRAL
jgi:hypothetical protein